MPPSSDAAHARRALRRVGAELCGRYRLQRLIGIGGMGAVYAGVHRNGHAVAIKVLHDRLSSNPDIVRTFRREALLVNRIDHPGVVGVMDDDVADDGCIFLVMPLLRGETVRARVQRLGRTLPVAEVVSIAHTMLQVLAATHARKIVHRDIKPENLFVTDDGIVKILDFGIARLFETDLPSATRSGRAVGTPAFMAPEQALGRIREIDGRTDLWAVGATMFSLLSGRLVHTGESASELLVRAATQPAPCLATVAPSVPAPLAEVVDRALAFERAARWSDAAAMDGALLAAARGVLESDSSEFPRLVPAPRASADIPAEPTLPSLAAGETDATNGESGASSSAPSGAARVALIRNLTPSLLGGRASVRALAAAAAVIAAVVLPILPLRGREHASPAEPVPSTADERAVALYRAARQSWSDASLLASREQLKRAVDADPTFAPAYLLLAVEDLWVDAEARSYFQRAWQHRDRLEPPQLALLLAYQPAMDVTPDLETSERRLAEAHARYPDDALISYTLARAQIERGALDDARATASDLSARSSLAVASFVQAETLLLAGKADGAIALYEQCLRQSPYATSCLVELATIRANRGECVQSEQAARDLVAAVPDSPAGYLYLARASFGRGAPLAAARAALRQEWDVMPAQERKVAELKQTVWLNVLAGDFDGAIAKGRELEDAIATDPDESTHADVAKLMAQIDLELGDNAAAVRVANEFAAARSAWTPDSYFDYGILPIRLRYLAGAEPRQDTAAQRALWLADQERRPSLVMGRSLQWILGYAQLVRTSEDAEEALRALPAYLPMIDEMTRDPDSDDAIGYTYMKTGRLDEARDYLARGASACRAVDLPLTSTWANLHLGDLLDQMGDRSGACSAYSVVIGRWGSDDRSVSARQARAAATRLGCAKSRR